MIYLSWYTILISFCHFSLDVIFIVFDYLKGHLRSSLLSVIPPALLYYVILDMFVHRSFCLVVAKNHESTNH